MAKTAELFGLFITVLGIMFIVFQIVVPALAGTPFFPMLRHRPTEARNKLAEALEEKQIRDIESEAASLSPKAEEPPPPTTKPTTQRKPKGK